MLSFDTIDDRPLDEPEYDFTARVIGRGLPSKAGAYILPYLQSGHMLLLGVLLLCTLVSYPGFPLTEARAARALHEYPRARGAPSIPALAPTRTRSPPLPTCGLYVCACVRWRLVRVRWQVPSEYRSLLLQGLGINFVLNLVAAVYARGVAERKQVQISHEILNRMSPNGPQWAPMGPNGPQ